MYIILPKSPISIIKKLKALVLRSNYDHGKEGFLQTHKYLKFIWVAWETDATRENDITKVPFLELLKEKKLSNLFL